MTPEFRVWDIPKDEFAIGNDAAMSLNGLYVWLPDPSTGDFNLTFPGDYVIEQYTGLKDVNGNKIFEGDIVHCENDYQGTDYTGKVMFFNGGFCVWTGGFRNYVWDDMIPEIIGNIHENPELLEAENEQTN